MNRKIKQQQQHHIVPSYFSQLTQMQTHTSFLSLRFRFIYDISHTNTPNVFADEDDSGRLCATQKEGESRIVNVYKYIYFSYSRCAVIVVDVA